MFKIFWRAETQKVESRLDRIGLVFLVLYIAIVGIGRKWLFGYWLEGEQLYVFGLAFTAGLLLGRVLAMIKDIRKVLVEENIIQQSVK